MRSSFGDLWWVSFLPHMAHILTNAFIHILIWILELVGVIRGRGSEKISVQSCFVLCFFYFSFLHISCCYTCNCNGSYAGRTKGALLQFESCEFRFVNPLLLQQTVLAMSFLKSSSPTTCTSLNIGCFFYIFLRCFWNEVSYFLTCCPCSDFFGEHSYSFSILFDRLPSFRNQWLSLFNFICSLIFWRR